MRVSRGRTTSWVALLVCVSGAASAQEPKVEVRADVILASNEGNTVDPPSLASVKDEFASAGIAFSSYRRLSSEKLSLTKQTPAQIRLPNNKVATLKLEEIKGGAATVKVKAEGAEVAIQLGREGQVFQRVGGHGTGQLILMLSAGASKQPRRAPAGTHPASPVGAP